ncbi:MAG: hypothetical protein JST54_09225 [Deltaproteobacteria bacterium]|nr:hypothetical protein [Deltaproteobacteria bacterium]
MASAELGRDGSLFAAGRRIDSDAALDAVLHVASGPPPHVMFVADSDAPFASVHALITKLQGHGFDPSVGVEKDQP